MSQSENSYLVISALGADSPGIVDAITQPINQSKGNILDSRMTVLGGEFAILMLIEASSETITSLEHDIPATGEKYGLTVITKRTEHQPVVEASVPYVVNVVSIDHPGIVNKLSGYFSRKNINIQNLDTDSYNAPHTGTPMFAVNMTVNIPASIAVANLRSEFLEFCDEMNLDAVMDPM